MSEGASCIYGAELPRSTRFTDIKYMMGFRNMKLDHNPKYNCGTCSHLKMSSSTCGMSKSIEQKIGKNGPQGFIVKSTDVCTYFKAKNRAYVLESINYRIQTENENITCQTCQLSQQNNESIQCRFIADLPQSNQDSTVATKAVCNFYINNNPS